MYKLSKRAVQDFQNLFLYTLRNFGLNQADLYTEKMDRLLDLISDNPGMGIDCAHISLGIRRYSHEKHSIYYRQRESDILVVRILHQRMNPLIHFDVSAGD